MEENPQSSILEGEIVGIRFGLASHKEICTASISDCPISHSSQLSNPFLGLPLEFGKCESCGTSEPGKCEGHFGYIELPIPIYHPSHIGELKRMLSLLCLKCLKLKKNKIQIKSNGIAERLLSCCGECSQVSIREVKTTDGACFLELKVPSRSRRQDGIWNFLERYGFCYGDSFTRPLLPCEVMEILKRIPGESRRKLAGKGYLPQDGFILRYLPVPPNCLSVPEISDGVSIMASDLSVSMLKKVLKQVEIIKGSRSGTPNFESHEVEANDLQSAVDRYLQVRGTTRASRDVDSRFGIHKESNESSTKAWLEKMRTLFIRKGCGFSSRSVITGDAYKRVNEIGIPCEIAQRITFEERVNVHNMKYLQELVDTNLCLTYRDGSSTYSLREGSKGHTFLRPGQVVHRRIMDGDIVFINRPPTTHKHSLQALSVYVHDDHTVKINPLICGPLSADFDGDCIHLFYPQSLAAKAEVWELFSVEKQLLSSHSGNLNLQLTTDSLLSLKTMFKGHFFSRCATQQLAMFVSQSLPQPALLKAFRSGPHWSALQILQTALPACFDCSGERFLIHKSDILKVDFNRDAVQSIVNEVLLSIFFEKGSGAVLKFFNSLQPLLMEYLFSEGFSVGLEDFSISRAAEEIIEKNFKPISPLLCNLRANYNELVELQIENHIRHAKQPIAKFILSSSALGDLVDSKSDSAVTKVVQQVGFLGMQISDRGKFYSKTLVEDLASLFQSKYPSDVVDYPSAQYGVIRSCFFGGLDPYEEMVHSVATREVIVRSSRGLSEPGTLFKNLMAILRDVVICYDGTIRNVCSNAIIQFEYGINVGSKSQSLFPAGEPVGVLAATAMSNPAYKAVLDSTPSSNSSWELMKEILLCKVSFKNDLVDRRVILYLNDCGCGRNYCQEKAAYLVKNLLEKVSLKDVAKCFTIEYEREQVVSDSLGIDAGLVGHIHLKKIKLQELNISMQVVLQKCEEAINSFRKKKKISHIFKKTMLSFSECCTVDGLSECPCLKFFWQDTNDIRLEKTSYILADIICPVLLETIIKGDYRVSHADIIWVSPETTSWIRNPSRTEKGEWALDIVLEKSVIKQSGDAWRIVLDSCLPVVHLIDTTRSIPYAIKQVQELLGVSCAFEQAVQRLSTSVTMVAKGVLKEHLILLANSMTCAGNLVGFNSGGYKALSRSLDVQVPFTEATLFTPRKCFERAAEKCHVDTLSSIVASCSWGKHVAVGTGSRFDVLWGTKEASLNVEGSADVYNFLNMVRSAANGEESVTACLGAEVDDLMPEDEIDDWNLSPEHNSSSNKPTFEDSAEFDKSNGWDAAEGWERNGNQNMENNVAEPNSWSGWATKKGETHDMYAAKPQEESARSSDWNDGAAWVRNAEGDNKFANETDTSNSNAWWAKKTDVHEYGSSENDEQHLFHQGTGPSAWDKQKSLDRSMSGWASSTIQEAAGKSSGWSTTSTWGMKNTDVDDHGSSKSLLDQRQASSWDNEMTGKQVTSGWASSAAKGWDKSEHPTQAWLRAESPANNHSWGKPKSPEVSRGWGTSKQSVTEENSHDWEMPIAGGGNVSERQQEWGQQSGEVKKNHFETHEVAAKSSGWNATSAWGTKNSDVDEHGPSKNDNQSLMDQGTQSSGWDNKMTRKQMTSGWAPLATEGWDKNANPTLAGQAAESTANNSSWGKPKSPEVSDGWGTPKESGRSENSHGWGVTGGGNGDERQQQWGQHGGELKKNRFEGSRGWGSNTGDWKAKKHRPAKPPGAVNDDSSGNAFYTVTRHRLDKFTSEEQAIVSEIEPIMQSVRRIMHNSGYSDGDPLSANDQSYILDSVFNYHPDKAVKMGNGIDHITVSRHSSFQESRCFYVVSTDGSRRDFSYRKCLENFIKGKYPALAEEFISKYFARTRPGGNRQQTPVPEGARDESVLQNPVSEERGD